MQNLIVQLELIRITAKQIHYSLNGDCFYSNHVLMDKISKHLIDFQDEIIESIIMADGTSLPDLQQVYLEIAPKTLKNPSLTDLHSLIQQTIYLIEEEAHQDHFQGDLDLLGRISNELRKFYALLSRVVMQTYQPS